MQGNKKFRNLFGTVAFLLCGILLFGCISNIMRRKTAKETDMVHSFYALEKDSLDVLFLGSSHVYYGIQPNVLWKQQGITSYIMGSPEQSVATAYYLLKEAFEYQNPKVVVMDSYYTWFDGMYKSEARLRQAFDGMRMGSVKREVIETMLPELGWKEALSYYLPFLKYHARWGELENYDFHTSPYLKGARIDYTVQQLETAVLPEKESPVPEINQTYLDKIQTLCEEHGAEFVMMAIPYGVDGKQETYEKRQGTNLALAAFLEEKQIPFHFYLKDKPELFDFQTDFRDKTHLNTEGATKLTEDVGSWLAEDYGLTGHQEDAAYASWNDDLAAYEADAAQQKEHPVSSADEE